MDFKNNIRFLCLSAAILAGSGWMAAQADSLQVIDTHGVKYYFYKTQKDDSIYGICKRFGWDENILKRCNPDFVKKFKKGATLYYPVDVEDLPEVTATTKKKGHSTASPVATPTKKQPALEARKAELRHSVKRGETVYSIASLYNVPVDLIYSLNPEARQGLRPGQTITISQPEFSISDTTPFFYTVKQGDTLVGVADAYQVSIEKLLSDNPGISETNFNAGDIIKISPKTSKNTVRTVDVTRETLQSFGTYKIKKNDTWETVAAATGVSAQALKEANPTVDALIKDEWLTIPNIVTQTVQKEVVDRHPSEATPEARKDIYANLHNISEAAAVANEVNVAVVLGDPSQKSNIDFLRGFLMGVDDLKKSPYKINMRVVNADGGEYALRADSSLTSADVIIGVFDSFPTYLSEVGALNGIEVVNVLDSKNTLYQQNPQTIQILQPIEYFNSGESNEIARRFPNSVLIMTGEIDNDDSLAKNLKALFDPSRTAYLTLEEFENFSFDDGTHYLVYAYPTRKDAIKEVADVIVAAKAANPETAMSVVGRPQWIAYAESLAEEFAKMDTYIPSRFYMEPASQTVKGFESRFKSLYNRVPTNSYPQYAMLGYDVASYFIPVDAETQGDYNRGVGYRSGLQNDINLKRLNTWSGFINDNSYLIHISPSGTYEKIEVK